MNPTYDFKGQVALVTGAAAGMGLGATMKKELAAWLCSARVAKNAKATAGNLIVYLSMQRTRRTGPPDLHAREPRA